MTDGDEEGDDTNGSGKGHAIALTLPNFLRRSTVVVVVVCILLVFFPGACDDNDD